MNAQEKLLVEALRSGKYRQGKGTLRTRIDEEELGPAFCCLGVACDVSGLGRWEGPTSCYVIRAEGGGYESGETKLPPTVRKWLGWADEYGPVDGISTRLTEMNDQGMSFAQIADLIEAGLMVEEGGDVLVDE